MEGTESRIAHELGQTVSVLRSDREHSLMLAAQKGHEEAVQWLVASNADVHAKRDGWTVLSVAASDGHNEV
eukprot:3689773-Rhodomonas_salina.1